MKTLISILLALVLTACASVEAQTPQQRLFAAQGEFNIALRTALVYTSQPPCSGTVLIGCHKPEVKAGIVESSKKAHDALKTAKAALATAQAADRVTAAAHLTRAMLNYMVAKGVLK